MVDRTLGNKKLASEKVQAAIVNRKLNNQKFNRELVRAKSKWVIKDWTLDMRSKLQVDHIELDTWHE